MSVNVSVITRAVLHERTRARASSVVSFACLAVRRRTVVSRRSRQRLFFSVGSERATVSVRSFHSFIHSGRRGFRSPARFARTTAAFGARRRPTTREGEGRKTKSQKPKPSVVRRLSRRARNELGGGWVSRSRGHFSVLSWLRRRRSGSRHRAPFVDERKAKRRPRASESVRERPRAESLRRYLPPRVSASRTRPPRVTRVSGPRRPLSCAPR